MTFREIRELKGIKTKYVAEKLGIQPRTLNRKERDNSFSTLQSEKLCELYDVKLDDVDI